MNKPYEAPNVSYSDEDSTLLVSYIVLVYSNQLLVQLIMTYQDKIGFSETCDPFTHFVFKGSTLGSFSNTS